MLPSIQEMEAYIRREAIRLGIDPNVAVEVARSEGLQEGTWQAKGNLSYGRERSYGPFQLHVDPTGKNPGLGNAFKAATGLDPADPSSWDEGVTFALQQAQKGGWGPWMGAAKIGIKGKYGIGNTAPAAAEKPMGAAMGSFEPAAIRQRMAASVDPVPGLLAPSQQDYSVSPSQAPKQMDWAALAQAGAKIAQGAQTEEEQAPEMPILQPQVLQPLRRITLGKGLLG